MTYLEVRDELVMTVKKSKMVKSLEKIQGVTNLSIDLNEVNEGRTKIMGNFDYAELHYSFFYSESPPLIISEISLSFSYEEVSFSSELNIYKAIDTFNSNSLAIKASILEMDTIKKELMIEFSCGSLLDPDTLGKGLIDLHPSIVILNRIPLKLSTELREKNVDHNLLEEFDDDSEEE